MARISDLIGQLPKDLTVRCGGSHKYRFNSLTAALAELVKIKAKGDRGRGYIETACYACTTCEGWHLTGHPQPQSVVLEEVLDFLDSL